MEIVSNHRGIGRRTCLQEVGDSSALLADRFTLWTASHTVGHVRISILHTGGDRIEPRDLMPIKPHNLTNSQAACLIALRHGNETKPSVAIAAKLDLTKTATALELLGLAKQNQVKRWHATALGKICRYNAVPDRLLRGRGMPGIGGLRLLALLDRPMRGGEIAEKIRNHASASTSAYN